MQQVASKTDKPISTITTFTSTTPHPRKPLPPLREPRPILDSLSWLWTQWQATAPRQKKINGKPGEDSKGNFSMEEEIETQSVLLSSGNLISTAIGVTRAISSFLGTAFQVSIYSIIVVYLCIAYT